MIKARSPIAEEVHFFHNWILMPIMVIISVFVLALLAIVVFKFNSKANPVPSKFSHNTLLEVVWTGVPILILLFISLFSFELLYKEDRIPDGKQIIAQGDGSQTDYAFVNDFNPRRIIKKKKHLDVFISSGGENRKLVYKKDYNVTGFGDDALTISLNEAAQRDEQVIIQGGRTRVGPGKFLDLFGTDRSEIAMAPTVTLKAIGRQWGWTYEYPGLGDFELVANLLPREETTEENYLFATTNDVVLPVGETIRLITTATDVIHAWSMPSFAVKIDAVPGRNNENWFKANATGMYYGQCSEICGKDHSFMPISVKVVTRPEFESWVDSQRALAGLDPLYTNPSSVKLADAAPTAGQ